MSLINDALKKAQKQRTGDSPSLSAMPAVGGEPAARIAKRGKPVGFESMILWICAGGVGLLILVVGGFFLFKSLNKPAEVSPAPAVSPAPVVVQATTAKPADTAPTPAAKPAETVSTTFVLPGTPAPVAPSPTPVTVTAAPVIAPPPVVETKPVVVETAAVVPPPPTLDLPKTALKMDPKAITFIESVRVAGIRYSTTDSKVLMNDHVYRVGDTVEHQLGLKLATIAAGALTFEDERGARYTRNF